jgi:hypothetical protein
MTTDPSQGAFDDPAFCLDDEAFVCFAPCDDLDTPGARVARRLGNTLATLGQAARTEGTPILRDDGSRPCYPMMRARHVMKLAKAKNCGFAVSADAPPVPTTPQR